jgi:hypothetical protein
LTITSPPLDFDAQDAGSNPEEDDGAETTGSRSRMQSALLALQEAVDGHPQGALAPIHVI